MVLKYVPTFNYMTRSFCSGKCRSRFQHHGAYGYVYSTTLLVDVSRVRSLCRKQLRMISAHLDCHLLFFFVVPGDKGLKVG